MSGLNESRLKSHSLSMSFVKIIIIVLFINALFSGVDFSQLGLPKGFSSILDFLLKFVLVFLLTIFYKIKNKHVIFLVGMVFIFSFGTLIGGYYQFSVYDKSLSLILNLLLWMVIFLYTPIIERKYCITDTIIKFTVLVAFLSILLYALAFLGYNTKFLDSAWLYDQNFRFSSTFNEPSLSGYFYGLMFLISLYSNYNYKNWFVFLFGVAVVLSGAKFTLIIIPALLILHVLFKFKGFGNGLYILIIVAMFSVYLSLALFYPYVFEFISSHTNESETVTYVTRFGFPVSSIYHSLDYPFGSGLYGFKVTLKPYIEQYCSSISKINVSCSELLSYINQYDIVAQESYAPKDVFSFVILSYGIPGLVFFIVSSMFFANLFKNNRNLYIIYLYILSSMLFVLPFRFILFFSIFIFLCFICRSKRIV
ncbi:hypothetical protein EC843_1011159 [Buttiauxella sp. JUb87]|uniref:oligosaccharide repeat unit polymerase n=1 Tax=Buttiauxella sp. JUb87 TaxID=2485129 RepID=UPI00105BFD6D|nr:oligosaccharide repeat unit polymerase [Buttiauxella sp. JUb87]TDN55096.1 hypothetical protein EC843_1011159 [Buttiauxella sp. JUb87]